MKLDRLVWRLYRGQGKSGDLLTGAYECSPLKACRPGSCLESTCCNFFPRKKMMVHHPPSSTGISAVDAVGALAHASQTTPSRTEAAKEEETLKSLVDVLQQGMRNVPAQGTPAQRSAVTPTLNDTVDCLWLKGYRKHAKKQKTLENVAMTRKPTPSTAPSVLMLQAAPDISVVLCVYEFTQLTTALKELALIFQTAASKKRNKALDQLINGFSEIFEDCFKKRNVKYRN